MGNLSRNIYEARFARHFDELKWLYMELYDNSDMFAELCEEMYRFYEARREGLKDLDEVREANPQWYRS